MKKIITLSIPEPCHEDWAKMTATEKGRHCEVCTKDVVDFTSKTDEAIVKYVSKNKNACGRFSPKQLNRALVLERKSTASLAPYAASLLLPLAMLNGQNSHTQGQAHFSNKPMISLGLGSSPVTDKIQITTTGKVTDSNGQPLVNVEISVLERNQSVKTFSDGTFSITTLNDETLLFHIPGFTSEEIKLGRKNTELNLQLQQEKLLPIEHPQLLGKIKEVIMGDVVEVIEEVKAETITISGNVIDDEGLQLPGANIFIKGTAKGTQSNFDGNYNLDVRPHDVLVFSYVGYLTREVTASNISNRLDIQMELDTEVIEQVIMTGVIIVQEFPNKGRSVGYTKPESNPGSVERRTWKKKLKEAHDNEIEFQRIKKAKKQEDKLNDSQ